MTYLSRLVLNGRSRQVQRDLSDCHGLHRTILSAFPQEQSSGGSARDRFGILYRLETPQGRPQVIVQSEAEPDWRRLPPGYLQSHASKQVDSYYSSIQPGASLRFRLRANPTRRISARNAEESERWRGRRVELRREADQLAWLRRKQETGGFQLCDVRLGGDDKSVPNVLAAGQPNVRGHRDGEALTFGSVTFEGLLRVTDTERFQAVLRTGIGSGKAFGFGLLSVAPAVVEE